MTQKFIDKDGLKVLWNQISLKDYPNNETLMAVIDAIDETKANKDEIVQADWNQTDENKLDYIKNKPFGEEKNLVDINGLTIENFQLGVDKINVPLEIGQVWNVQFSDSISFICDVKQADDGTLYIGSYPDIENGDYKFYITPTDSKCYGRWAHLVGVSDRIILTGVSGVYAENLIHYLDPKYIKDMYYTGDPVETFIVEETTITLEEGADPIGIINPSQPLEVGKEYIVAINNTKYNAICKKHNGMGMSYLGNLSIIEQEGPDTEEPFFTAPFNSDTELGFVFASDVLEYTVSISTVAPEIHYLDSKYIKDMYYKEINEVEVLPQSSLLFGYTAFDDVLLPTPLIEGSSYTVNWNGTEYECVARIGEWGVYIENIDVPFYIETINDGDLYTYIETANTGSHTISIYNNTDSVEVLPETSVELNDYIVERPNELNEMLVEGSEYTVNWNGTEYKCIAYGDENEAYIGNTALDGDDSSESDEPFFILTNKLGNYSLIIPSEEGTHDIHITGKVKTIHKIDREYLSGLVGISGTGENSEIFNDYRNNIASGSNSHAEGNNTTASGSRSHAEGYSTIASGANSHAEGSGTTASGYASHAEGSGTTASGYSSHAEGDNTTASGSRSHAEGSGTKITLSLTGNANTTTYTVSSNNSNIKVGRVLNYGNTYAMITSYNKSTLTITTDKTLDSSNALSNTTVNLALGIASGYYSHAEGSGTTASGANSHAEGSGTIASGSKSHAEGYSTIASGANSHAEGQNTIASGDSQHVQGKYNVSDADADGNPLNNYAHIVGNGTSNSSRSNAHTLDWNGNAWFSGDVYTGSTSGTNKDEGSKKLATEEYVDSQIPTDDDALALSIEMGLIEPIENNGYVLTDANGVIYTI